MEWRSHDCPVVRIHQRWELEKAKKKEEMKKKQELKKAEWKKKAELKKAELKKKEEKQTVFYSYSRVSDRFAAFIKILNQLLTFFFKF